MDVHADVVEIVNVQDRHRKFWRAFMFDTVLVANWGRVGTTGQFKVEQFPDGPGEITGLVERVTDRKVLAGYRPRATSRTVGQGVAVTGDVHDRLRSGSPDRAVLKALVDQWVQVEDDFVADSGPADGPFVWVAIGDVTAVDPDRRTWGPGQRVAAGSRPVGFADDGKVIVTVAPAAALNRISAALVTCAHGRGLRVPHTRPASLTVGPVLSAGLAGELDTVVLFVASLVDQGLEEAVRVADAVFA